MSVHRQDGARIVYMVGEFTFKIFGWTTMEKVTAARILQRKNIRKHLLNLKYCNKDNAKI